MSISIVVLMFDNWWASLCWEKWFFYCRYRRLHRQGMTSKWKKLSPWKLVQSLHVSESTCQPW
jgi:hypothetical protein